MATDYRIFGTYPLGIRNNNPGNMRPGQNWQGEVGENGGFSVFSDIGYGVRAWLISFHTAITLHGRSTLAEYITAYAPPSENDTAAYIAAMSRKTGIAADDIMPLDKDSVIKIMRAQFAQEDGAAATLVSDEDIQAGFDRLSPLLRAFFLFQRIRREVLLSYYLLHYLSTPSSNAVKNG